MKERVFQLRFDGELPVDVTPPNFQGLQYLKEKPIGRFVRETNRTYQIEGTLDAVGYFTERIYQPFSDFQQEEVWLLLLNTKHVVIYEVMLYRGTLNSAALRYAEVFRDAIRYNAAAVIMAYNHPIGDAKPSREDIQTTKEIHHASLILDIKLLDHLIIGENQWTSMKSQNLGFPPRFP